MRNLVIVHLESLNLLNYRMNRDEFPVLRKIEKESLSFNKYFSTSTSTLMVIGDLLYGGLEQYEQCESLDYIPEQYPYPSSLMDDLRRKGYKTNIFIYPDGADRESAEKRHIAGFYNKMVLINDYNEYLNALDKAMSGDMPFALMACNYISNVAINHYAPNSQHVSGSQRWINGYRFMDKSVCDLWEILKNKKLLDCTTVLFYGDHGDDYWQHSYHGGLVHAIEPYARLVWTPMWIYDNRIKPGETSRLISTIDIRQVINELLFAKRDRVDIYHLFERKYAFCRSSYTAQPVRRLSFNKAYSLTDGKWFMLVSAEGLELYDIEMDPECQNNFLDFFVLEKDNLLYRQSLNGKMKFHYGAFMNEKEIRLVRQKFYFYRECLRTEVRQLYALIGKVENISEMDFERLRLIHNYM